MIHPLIGNDQRTLRIAQVGDGILGKDCNVVGGDQFRNTVVDFRINMIRTTGKHDPSFPGFLQISKNLLTLCLHIPSGVGKFFPA